jgi:hypothetical protein
VSLHLSCSVRFVLIHGPHPPLLRPQLRALEATRQQQLQEESSDGPAAALDMAAFNVELFRRAVSREAELLDRLRTLTAEARQLGTRCCHSAA